MSVSLSFGKAEEDSAEPLGERSSRQVSGQRNGIGDESTRVVARSHGRGERAITLKRGEIDQIAKARQKLLVRRGIEVHLDSIAELFHCNGLECADPFPLQREFLETPQLAGSVPKYLQKTMKTGL
jgi:hypothetical protein